MADIKKVIRMVVLGDDKGALKMLQGVGKEMKGISGLGGKLAAGWKTDGIKGVGSALKTAAGDAGGMAGIAKGTGLAVAGVGVAAAAAGAAIAVKFGKDSVDTFKRVAGETAKLKRVTGLTTEDASRMGFAFKQSGVDAGQGTKGMQLLAKNLTNAADGGKKAAAMSKLLGFGFTDAAGKVLPMAKLMPKLADKFASMPDGASKTALAMKLFGKSGTELLPFLNKGAAGLAALSKKSDEFGNTLSDKDLQALKDSKQAQREWDAAMQGLQVTLGKYLLPVLTSFAKAINSVAIPAFQGIAGWVDKNQGLFTALGNVLKWVWNNAILPVLKLLIQGWAMQAEAVGNVIAAVGHFAGDKGMEDFGNSVASAAKDTEEWAKSLQGIPDDVAPTVDVKGEQAQKELTTIHSQIASLKDRLVTAKAKGDDKQVRALKKSIDALKSKAVTITTNLKKGRGVTYNARLSVDGTGQGKLSLRRRGGFTPAGLTVVGEDGPELRYFSRASSIVSSARTRQIMSGPASSGPQLTTTAAGDVYNFHFAGVLTEAQAGAVYERALVKLKQSRKGRRLGFS